MRRVLLVLVLALAAGLAGCASQGEAWREFRAGLVELRAEVRLLVQEVQPRLGVAAERVAVRVQAIEVGFTAALEAATEGCDDDAE